MGIPLWKKYYYSPRQIIQPWTQAGECWPFKGHHGKVEIHLAHTAKLHSVTLEHIPLMASLTGVINSAPKEFYVYGYFKEQYFLLGSFKYDIEGKPSQTFVLKNHEMKNKAIRKILLEVVSNWGNSEYTCIYRFKVHGKVFQIVEDNIQTIKPE